MDWQGVQEYLFLTRCDADPRLDQTFLANYSVATQVQYSPPVSSDIEATFPPHAVVAVHGGIHPSWANVTRINEVGHSFLQRLINAGISSTMSIPRDTPYEERDLYSSTGKSTLAGART